jgi:hypothetical protein
LIVSAFIYYLTRSHVKEFFSTKTQ